jgi:hypothetical protein
MYLNINDNSTCPHKERFSLTNKNIRDKAKFIIFEL